MRMTYLIRMWAFIATLTFTLSAQQQDSIAHYKSAIVKDLRKYEALPPAMKLFSKIFADDLKNAKKKIDRAKKLAPADIEIEYLAGILARYQGELRSAEAKFKEVISKNDHFIAFGLPNPWLQLGQIYRELGDYELAVDAYKQGALVDLTDTWPLIELSMVFIDMRKDEEASEAFYGGLNDIQDQEHIDRLYVDCKELITKPEEEKWKDSVRSASEQLEFLKIFWKRRDPNPINPINERLIEHYRRLNFARQNYSKAFSPWYDDRGALYIRLGKPDRVYLGKPQADIKENESWFYDNIKSGLFFDFVDMGGQYENRSLFDAVSTTASSNAMIELFNERSFYNPYYQRMAVKLKTQADVDQLRAEERIQNVAGLQNTAPLFDRLNRAGYAAQALGRNDNAQDNLFNQTYANQQYFVFDAGAKHLPINCNFASFRGDQGKSRLEFYYVVPFKQLSFIPSISETNKFSTGLSVNFALFDMKYNEIANVNREHAIQANSTEMESHFFLDQVQQDLPPGKYVVALELRNNEKDRVGIYQFVVSTRDYSADTLSVSDVEIAQYVEATLSKDKYVKPRTNLKVVPNPAVGLLRTKPLTVYYEVYNLTLNDEGKSAYQVSYSIKMVDTEQSFLSSIAGVFSNKEQAATTSTTTKEGRSRTEREYIGFDISELPAGVAVLEVRVKDLLSLKETASKIPLTIIDENTAQARP